MEATEYLNAGDAKPFRQPSPQDVPNRFSMSAFYELPFGKGQLIGSHMNKWADAAIGGWQIEGSYVYQSGFPVRFANDAFYLGGQIAVDNPTVERWFNTSAFITGSTPVDHLRTLPFFFGSVRSDPINNADLGVRKDIHLREGSEDPTPHGIHQCLQSPLAERRKRHHCQRAQQILVKSLLRIKKLRTSCADAGEVHLLNFDVFVVFLSGVCS